MPRGEWLLTAAPRSARSNEKARAKRNPFSGQETRRASDGADQPMPNCNAPLTCANCKCTLAITGMRAHAPAWKKRATGSTRKARTRHRRMRLPLSQINVHLCAEKVSVTGSMTSVRLTESVTQGRGQRTPRTPLPPDLRCSLPFRCHEACGTRFSVVAYMIIRPSSSLSPTDCCYREFRMPTFSRHRNIVLHVGWSLPNNRVSGRRTFHNDRGYLVS